jgi:prepilin-type N-terminal cleavage/methylation domain-containing protein
MKSRNTGFTLIELLVVVSIIGFLSSIIFAALQSARDKAQVARARYEMNEIVKAITIAQGETNQRFLQIAPEGNWTAGFCTANGHVPTEPGCLTRVDTVLTKVETATNGIYSKLPRLDPWGIPYQFDANYGENIGGNFCIRDSFYLVKSDGSSRTVPNLPAIPKEPLYPGC